MIGSVVLNLKIMLPALEIKTITAYAMGGMNIEKVCAPSSRSPRARINAPFHQSVLDLRALFTYDLSQLQLEPYSQ